MKKVLIASGIALVAVVAIAATWSNTWIDGLFTGNGTLTTDIALPMWGANQNATVQISRNQTGDGGGECSALDVYSGAGVAGTGGCPWPASYHTSVGGFAQRWFIDCAVDGGKCASMTFDYGGFLRLRGSIIASGITLNPNGPGAEGLPVSMYPDGYAIMAASDMPYGVGILTMGNPYASEGDANSQALLILDAHIQDAGIGEYSPNVRMAIDGNSGAMRWSNSIANSYRTATWDAKFGRVAANILGDSTGTTSLQTYHLDQPSGKNEVAGTISIVAANNLSFAFVTAYAQAPICTISPRANPGGVTYWVTSTTTTVKVNLSAVSTLSFNYICVGNPN